MNKFYISGSVSIPDSTTDQAFGLDFTDFVGKPYILQIDSNHAILIKLNDTSQDFIHILADTPYQFPFINYNELPMITLTEIYGSNSSGSTATVNYFILGDRGAQ